MVQWEWGTNKVHLLNEQCLFISQDMYKEKTKTIILTIIKNKNAHVLHAV